MARNRIKDRLEKAKEQAEKLSTPLPKLKPQNFRNALAPQKIAKEQQALNTVKFLRELHSDQSGIAAGTAGFATGLVGGGKDYMDKTAKKTIEKDKKLDRAFTGGQVAGTVAQFAAPYGAASKPISAAATKLLPNAGKLTQKIAGSVAADLAVGLPLNVNYALNTEGLKGKDALKSVGFNTGLDLVTGGVLEAAPAIGKIFKGTAKTPADKIVKEIAQPDMRPKAPSVTVHPRNPNLGAEIPKEQPFVKMGDIPKAESKVKNIAESFPNENMQSIIPDAQKTRGFSKNVATDQYSNPELKKTFTDAPETYTVLSNADTLKRADEIFLSGSTRESYDTVMKAITSNALRPEHVPLARKVANQLARDGDVEGARNILSEIAVKQTESGQFSQAAAILRNSDPMAVMQFIEKTVKKTNEELKKRIKGFDGLKLTDDEIKRLADIDVGDEEAIKQAVEDIGKRLAKEIPSSWFEKFDELRRIAMLGNFKTQARNLVGNVPLALERKLSNKTSALLQKALPKDQRTQAFFTSKKSRQIAKQLYANDKDWLLDSNKWDTNDLRKILNQEREVFNQSVIGRVAGKLGATGKGQAAANNIGIEGFRKLVYGSLQTGDVPFLKSAYTDRMASYISAQGYKSLDDVPQKVLDTAREEALKATFRDSNAAAKFINDIKRKGGLVGKTVEATLPFVTTPTNLVRRTIDYSPAGLIRSLAKMKKADDVPKVIDEMAQGLTGTALIGVGAYLAQNGILIGKADDSKKKANYEKTTGKQPFSIQTPLGTITYDWAQPFGSQLAVAAEMYKAYDKAIQEKGEFTYKDFADSVLQSGYAGIDVILQSSVYQNVLDLFNGFGSPGERITQNIIEYPLQVIPTMLGQGTRSQDPFIRNQFDKTSKLGSFKNSVMGRIPTVSESLPIKYDVWGRPMKRVEGTGLRTAQEFLNPANVLAKNETPLDREILSLNSRTGTNDVFPRTAPYNFKVGGNKYELNNKDVSEFQKVMGQYAQKEANKLVKSSEYKTMTDDDKVKALNGIYSDAAKEAKMNHLINKGDSPLLLLSDAKQENYSEYLKDTGLSEEKYIEVLKAIDAANVDGKGQTKKAETAKALRELDLDPRQKQMLMLSMYDKKK